MTQDEIIRMAREAGFAIQELGDKTCHVVVYNFQDSETDVTKELECFADLVAAKLFTYEQVKAHIQAVVLSERESCAKVCDEGASAYVNSDYTKGLVHGARLCAAAIRAIKFECDTGFRPVSEMVAEHKQDPKKAAAIEKAKMRKAEQEPVGRWNWNKAKFEWLTKFDYYKHHMTPLYAAPVHAKDLTDDEIMKINVDTASIESTCDRYFHFARAVIAADRRKNRV